MKISHIAITAITLALSFPAITAPAHADEDMAVFGVGYFDVIDQDDPAADFRAEYRWGDPLFWAIKPLVGVEITSDGAVMGLGGVYADWGFTPNWYLTPSFAAGLYAQGDGKDLGYPIEFRSQIELSYEFTNQHRLGVGFSHISNMDLDSNDNPGAEILSVHYHLPISTLVGH